MCVSVFVCLCVSVRERKLLRRKVSVVEFGFCFNSRSNDKNQVLTVSLTFNICGGLKVHVFMSHFVESVFLLESLKTLLCVGMMSITQLC